MEGTVYLNDWELMAAIPAFIPLLKFTIILIAVEQMLIFNCLVFRLFFNSLIQRWRIDFMQWFII